MTKARDIADLGAVTSRLDTVGASDGALSNRNVIVNGRFDVWQRSTGPITSGGYTTVDRWRFPSSGTTTEQVSNDRDLSIPYALKVTADGTGYGIAQTRIEDVRTLSGKDATFSIWVKSPTTGAFRFFIEQNFGSGGSSTVSILDNASQFSIASANTWEQFTVTVAMPSISGKTLGTAHHVSLGIGANSGTANRVMYYSEAQLEVGDTATPFEHRSYGDELARCQRYYQTSFERGVTPNGSEVSAVYQTAVDYGSGYTVGHVFYQSNMRGTPTVVTYTTNPSSSATTNRVSFYNGTSWSNCSMGITNRSESAFALEANTGDTNTVLLQFNYTADAEL
jgi:hypothetical protein